MRGSIGERWACGGRDEGCLRHTMLRCLATPSCAAYVSRRVGVPSMMAPAKRDAPDGLAAQSIQKKLHVDAPADASPPAAAVVPTGKVVPKMPPPEPLHRPTAPGPENLAPGTAARPYMRLICPWVLQELPKYMQDHHKTGAALMQEMEPLKIHSGPLSSFKEPWVPCHAFESLATTGLYEAGGNLCWIDPEVQSSDSGLAGASEDPSWEWVWTFSDLGFQSLELQGVVGGRIRFPIPLETYWEHHAATKKDAYPKGLKLLAAHAYVWAWYVAVFRSLGDCDHVRTKLLYECALTATVCTRCDCRPEALASDFLMYAERVREGTKALCVNFITFMDKVSIICGDSPDLVTLQKKQLRFAGGLVNGTMVRTIKLLQASLTPECRRLIGELDRRYGRDMLSGSYNKMRLLLQGCQQKGTEASSNLEWSLQSMLVMLLRKECHPTDFTVATFSKARDGSPSWISQAVACRCVVEHVSTVVENISRVDPPLSQKIQSEVLAPLANPVLFNQRFPVEVTTDGDKDGDMEERLATESPGEQFVSECRSKLPKAGLMVVELLRKVYSGEFHKSISALALEADLVTKLAANDESLSDIGKELNDMMRAIHAAESVVATESSGPPKASLRELVRSSSAPEDRAAAEAERADVWRRAVAQRKKFVSLGLVKEPKKATSYADVFQKALPVRTFRGTPNDEHRVFVVSCDLMNQCGQEPWLEPSAPPDDQLTAALEFVKTQRDTFDVALAFDGTMRKSRRIVEDSFSDGGAAEFAVVYDQAPSARFQRRNFMSHRNVELGYVRMPLSRAKVSVRKRMPGFGASGETSSTYTSYSGVSMIPRTALAKIAPDQKASIFPEVPISLPKRWPESGRVGVPLIWLETKSVEFWSQLLDDLNAKCIVDVSLGSGTLAQACMSKGIHYFGMCVSASHLSWLSNVLDRACLKFVVESGSYLYQEDLAEHVKELFADVLQSFGNNVDEDAVQVSDDETMT